MAAAFSSVPAAAFAQGCSRFNSHTQIPAQKSLVYAHRFLVVPMAAAFSYVPTAALALGFRRFDCHTEITAVSLLRDSAKFRQSFRLGNGIGGSRLNHGLQKVSASGVNPPPNPKADEGKVHISSSNVADGPPLATILAGIVVFLLFCWVVGFLVMWIVGLIVNVPSA